MSAYLRTRIFLPLTLCLAALTALAKITFDDADRLNYLPVVLLWIASGMVCALVFAPTLQDARRWWEAKRIARSEWLGVVALTLCAGILRFFELGAIPNVVVGDEGLLGQAAMMTRENPLANPFALFENVGSLYLYAIRFCIEQFGRTAFALRLVPAIIGTCTIPLVYLFAREWFGRRVGLFAAFLMAFSHAHIHFTRIVAVPYIISVLFIPLEFYLLISGLEKRSAFRLALGGLTLGVHFQIYLGAQVVTVLIAIILVALFIAGTRTALRDSIPFWFGAFIAGLPGLVFALRYPDEFMSRLNADGTFHSGWLEQEVAITGQSSLAILGDRVVHAFLTLVYYPTDDFYGAPMPLLTYLSIACLMMGIGVALWRVREPRYLALSLYFWSMPFAVGLFAIPASADSYRMLIALPACVVLAALGLEQVVTLFHRLLPHRLFLRYMAMGVALLSIIGLNLKTYFVDFAPTCTFGNTFDTRFASYLGRYVQQIERGRPVFLLSGEFVYGTNEAVDFFTDDWPIQNLPKSIEGAVLPAHTIVIATPKRMDELRRWARQSPDGTFDLLSDCGQPILLALRLP